MKAHDAGFGETRRHARDAAHFARETELAERNCIRGERAPLEGRRDGERNAEVERGFVDADTAGDVDEDVARRYLDPRAPRQNREDHRQATAVNTRRRAARTGNPGRA